MNEHLHVERPIFLLGAHKSGTSLLRSLFDGHPDLFVIPVESHLFECSGFWVDYALRKTRPTQKSRAEIIESFTTIIQMYNQTGNPQADSVTYGLWNVEAFRAFLEQQEDLSTPRLLFNAVFCAMHQSLYGSPLPAYKRVVEKSVEHAEFALELHRYYPDAKFIHIVRNPYANLTSLRRFKSQTRYPFLKGILRSLYNAFYFLLRNERLLGDTLLVVRYEELVTQPERTIKRMAQFVGIGEHPALYRPTLMGKSWKGNSVYGTQFEGISTQSLNRWESEIHPWEIRLLNEVLPAYVWQRFKYDRLPTPRGGLKPMPGERLRTYVANRLLWYFI